MSRRALFFTIAAFLFFCALGAGLYFFGWGVLFGHKRPQPPASLQCQSRKANAKLTFRLADAAKKSTFQSEIKDKYGTYFAEDAAFLSGSDVEEFYPAFDKESGRPIVFIQFTSRGAEKLNNATQSHVGKFIVVAVGDRVVSVPRIASAIPGGQVQLNMDFQQSHEEAYQEILQIVDQICLR